MRPRRPGPARRKQARRDTPVRRRDRRRGGRRSRNRRRPAGSSYYRPARRPHLRPKGAAGGIRWPLRRAYPQALGHLAARHPHGRAEAGRPADPDSPWRERILQRASDSEVSHIPLASPPAWPPPGRLSLPGVFARIPGRPQWRKTGPRAAGAAAARPARRAASGQARALPRLPATPASGNPSLRQPRLPATPAPGNPGPGNPGPGNPGPGNPGHCPGLRDPVCGSPGLREPLPQPSPGLRPPVPGHHGNGCRQGIWRAMAGRIACFALPSPARAGILT
jgi:hypothetical protein